MLASWLSLTARAFPSAPAVGYGTSVTHSYEQLALKASQIAGWLQLQGFKPGDRIALFMKNSPAYMEILYGIWWGGYAAVPINNKLHDAEVAWILEHSGAKFCFDKQPQYGESVPVTPVSPHDLAWLFYTSGTTGRPKGAMLTFENLVQASYAYMAEVDEVKFGSTILHAAPMSHGSGLYIMAHILRGGINIIPESGGFDPFEISETINHWGNVGMFAAPTMIKRIVDSRYHYTDFRTIIWGGAPMYEADILRTSAKIPGVLAQIYGQGESPMTITTLTKREIEAGVNLTSAGRAYGMMQVKITDDAGHALPIGETGEIICKGLPVMAGYWNNDEATRKSLRDGWLFTGDMGAIDQQGYLTLKDRSKDLIISGGSNIYPREVEEVLLKHPKVREVSVIGRIDAEWGEVVIAYYVGEASREELDTLCLNNIARFKRPKEYIKIENLPKNNYGKILKRELRAIDLQK
jgi:long-chain acyl-CoA synthetase